MQTRRGVPAARTMVVNTLVAAKIFNTDQGSQFTSTDFVKVIAAREIKLSLDGEGAWRDKVFVDRLWRPSNTRRSNCKPMPASRRPAPGSAGI